MAPHVFAPGPKLMEYWGYPIGYITGLVADGKRTWQRPMTVLKAHAEG